MNRTPSVERVLREYLADDGASAPDYVLDVVADRISGTRQRRSWPLLRRLQMNTYTKLAAAAVVAAIAVGAIYLNLPNRDGVGGQTPSPSPTPTATPTTSPQPTGPIVLTDDTDDTLTGGRYILQPMADPSTVRIAANIPAGWHAFGAGTLASPGQTDGILLAFMVTEGLFADSCHWDLNGTGLDQPGDIVVGPTVDDLVAALKANTSYTSSATSPVTFGLFEGQELELQLPGDDVLSTCDMHGAGSPFTGTAFYVFPGGFYAQGPNSRWHLYIVDIQGTRLITMISIVETATAADIAAAEAIVASFEITP